MAVYKGYPYRTDRGGFMVTKDGNQLKPDRSQRVYNHSPNGFNWGYGGSGPAQLALALLLEEIDENKAVNKYQKFKWEIVAHWPMDSAWELGSESIKAWLNKNK